MELDNQWDSDWQQLQSDWQSYKPDIAKIKRRIAWVTWRMIAILTLDALIVVTYFPFIIYWVISEDTSLAELIWHYSMFPLILFGVYLDFKLRLPLFKLESESTKDILAFYLKRVNAGVSIGKWGYQFSILFLMVFIVWVAASFYFDLAEDQLQQPLFILFGLSFIGLFAIISFWYKNKKQREASRLALLWKEFLE